MILGRQIITFLNKIEVFLLIYYIKMPKCGPNKVYLCCIRLLFEGIRNNKSLISEDCIKINWNDKKWLNACKNG